VCDGRERIRERERRERRTGWREVTNIVNVGVGYANFAYACTGLQCADLVYVSVYFLTRRTYFLSISFCIYTGRISVKLRNTYIAKTPVEIERLGRKRENRQNRSVCH
jgi:hypothetical protein